MDVCLSVPIGYLLEIEVHTSNVEAFRNLQNTVKLPKALSETSNITGLSTTTGEPYEL